MAAVSAVNWRGIRICAGPGQWQRLILHSNDQSYATSVGLVVVPAPHYDVQQHTAMGVGLWWLTLHGSGKYGAAQLLLLCWQWWGV